MMRTVWPSRWSAECRRQVQLTCLASKPERRSSNISFFTAHASSLRSHLTPSGHPRSGVRPLGLRFYMALTHEGRQAEHFRQVIAHADPVQLSKERRDVHRQSAGPHVDIKPLEGGPPRVLFEAERHSGALVPGEIVQTPAHTSWTTRLPRRPRTGTGPSPRPTALSSAGGRTPRGAATPASGASPPPGSQGGGLRRGPRCLCTLDRMASHNGGDGAARQRLLSLTAGGGRTVLWRLRPASLRRSGPKWLQAVLGRALLCSTTTLSGLRDSASKRFRIGVRRALRRSHVRVTTSPSLR